MAEDDSGRGEIANCLLPIEMFSASIPISKPFPAPLVSVSDQPIILSMPVLHAQLPAAPAAPSEAELSRILRLEVPIIVKLAERKLSINEVMRLGAGAIIEFLKSSEEPLQLLVNNKAIGLGEAVKVGENFGLRITQIGDVRQIVAAISGQP